MPVSELLKVSAYVAPMLIIWGCYWLWRARADRHSRHVLAAATEAGLTEPSSLHPLIDPVACIGCRSCVTACPEGDVLGLIDGKARLINPTHCIGHGACKDACPMGAIALVFGTERRGVDIPFVSKTFETNVPGIFIAGELGGMGLIRNAIEQGRQAMEAIAKRGRAADGGGYDVVIVGAGPAGFSASLAAMERGLRFLTLEQESLGGTVAHYPRRKIVMTAPVELPVVGKTRIRETTKEALLEFWQEIARQTGIAVNYNERVESVTREQEGFLVQTPRATYRTRNVLLAIGRRGTPRKLDVPGEELPKVVYRLTEPEQYRDKDVLVVGGGDSALEAAASLADEAGTRVTLSYRGDALGRAREQNRARVRAAEATGRLRLLLGSRVVGITPTAVALEQAGQTETLPNDAVIVCAGGVLPTAFLAAIGVAMETKFGTS
jgi:thioredoxin reductase/NAD-dependent dihydropyrimidine dehydrogenase PreA subunit